MSRYCSIFIIIFSACFILIPAASAEDQYITVGNMVNITVLGYPELSKSVVVRQDGTTDYPLLANTPIKGLTLLELKELLFPLLTRYVERPRLFINISEYSILQIRVQGEVRNPGPYQVQGPIDLQGAISVAGGVLTSADIKNMSIIRRVDETKQIISINLYEYLQDERAAELPEIADSDIIIVPTLTAFSYVRVLGEVRTPGNYLPIDKNTSIIDVINLAGGVLPSGDMNKIYYISSGQTEYMPQVIKVEKLWKSGQLNTIPLVKPGDIIIVGEISRWKNLSVWSQIIYSTAILISSAVILYRL